ncbi:Fur family transcriptional regulator [Reyranella massiliensis]|uniref:Fur family transcriptional regulator n=1 Tax=Reyranella massiliensis TaxID=445220 RepID=UPI0005C29CA0|nr:Fur family transcriptional regulator [Reyranella massiliensis]
MKRLEDLCRERGVRLTDQRRIVLEVIEAATDHPCTFEIYRRASVNRKIGMATVYRALSDLTTAGLITRHIFTDGKARYKIVGRDSHSHLIDVVSGAILEVTGEGLRALLEEQARKLGYRLVDFRLRMVGTSPS